MIIFFENNIIISTISSFNNIINSENCIYYVTNITTLRIVQLLDLIMHNIDGNNL